MFTSAKQMCNMVVIFFFLIEKMYHSKRHTETITFYDHLTNSVVFSEISIQFLNLEKGEKIL